MALTFLASMVLATSAVPIPNLFWATDESDHLLAPSGFALPKSPRYQASFASEMGSLSSCSSSPEGVWRPLVDQYGYQGWQAPEAGHLSASIGSVGGGSVRTLGLWVLLPVFPDTEMQGWDEAYPRPPWAQQVHQTREVPHGHSKLASLLCLRTTGSLIWTFKTSTSMWPFCRVMVGDGHFQYAILPFSLSSAPWVFTK